MAIEVPITGELSYNGWDFTGVVKSTVVITPIFDEAGRSRVANEYVFTVDDYVSVATASADDVIETVRSLLTVNGGEFHYDGKGIGDPLAVNAIGGAVFDMDWGPKARLLGLRLVGNNIGVAINWQCRMLLPECETLEGSKGEPMAWNYTIDWDIDDEGSTTRTISGYVEIALTKYFGPGDTSIFATADDIREKITPPLLPGFIRRRKYTLSANRKRLNFSIIDKEMETPLPTGIVKGSVRHSIESNTSIGLTKWEGVISGSLTTAIGQPKASVIRKIFMIINSRLGKDANAAVGKHGDLPKIKFGIYIDKIRIEEGIFDRSTDFSIHYKMLGDILTLEKVLTASKLWSPLPINYPEWHASLTDTVFHPRGAAKLFMSTKDDAVMSICDGNIPKGNPGGKGDAVPQLGVALGGAVAGMGFGGKQIDPAVSWLWYVCKTNVKHDNRIILHKPLNAAAHFDINGPAVDADSPFEKIQKAIGGIGTMNIVSTISDILQKVCGPDIEIELVGEAQRIGHEIPEPGLEEYAGLPVYQTDNQMSQTIVGSVDGFPIYHAKWRQTYVLLKPPTGKGKTASNPALAATAGATAGGGAAAGAGAAAGKVGGK